MDTIRSLYVGVFCLLNIYTYRRTYAYVRDGRMKMENFKPHIPRVGLLSETLDLGLFFLSLNISFAPHVQVQEYKMMTQYNLRILQTHEFTPQLILSGAYGTETRRCPLPIRMRPREWFAERETKNPSITAADQCRLTVSYHSGAVQPSITSLFRVDMTSPLQATVLNSR